MVSLELRREDQAVWASPADIEELFGIGYRANSARAIEFRRWATDVRKRYLLTQASRPASAGFANCCPLKRASSGT
ncbi:virulence RhuM family protein [Microbacterium lushaniae]|nr:virulence RhuM family protein [Microbacterium lushaniae]KAA9153434.1 virulence RhuM family protein [Microbacterium lushaniae]